MDNYKKLFHESPAPMFIYDSDSYKFLAVNDAALHQYGYTRIQFLSMTILQIRPENDKKTFLKTNASLPKKYSDFGRWRHLKKNGEMIYVHIYAHTIDFEGKKARAVLALNIDKKVKAEVELQQALFDMTEIRDKIYNNEQNLSAIINNTNDIIWSVDKEFNVISGNQAYWNRIKLITGKSSSEAIKSDYKPEIVKRWQDYYDRAFKGETFTVKWTEEHEDRITHEEISFNPIRDKNHEISGISCFSRDVTESFEYQRKIEDQNKKLKEIGWIQSHKIRAPVSTLMGLLQLLDVNGESIDEPNKKVLSMIRDMVDNFDDVIHEINALTKTIET